MRQNWMRVSEAMPACAQNEQTQRESEMRRQRRDSESGVPGTGDATMEEWSKKPASEPWLLTGHHTEKADPREESSSGETEFPARRDHAGPTDQGSSPSP